MRNCLSSLKRKLYLVVSGYFRFWADISLRKWRPRIIAITGSVGKTTMLHLIEQQLAEEAHYSHFANSVYGISFDIVGLRGITKTKLRWIWLFLIVPFRALMYQHREKFYVVEVDADRPKEMEYVAKWLKPEITLWISLGRSHAANFDSEVKDGKYRTVDEAIAHEFAWLPKNTKKIVIYDGDNELICNVMADIKIDKLPVTNKILKSYDVWPNHTIFKLIGGEFDIPHPVPKNMYVQLGMLGKLAQYLNVKPKYDLSALEMPPGRNSFFEGKKGTKLIDSSYNAHLISISSMIWMMGDMKADHKWLVISDIIELGASEAEHHAILGDILASVQVDKYILIGRRTREYTKPVLEKLGKGSMTKSFLKTSEATRFIESNIKGGEAILFKGSQYLELIVESLLLHPEDAKNLPRREAIASKRRSTWEAK